MTVFSKGVKAAVERPGLVGLLYAFNLVIGLLLTVPVYMTLNSTTGLSGFSTPLAHHFDITLWMDIMEDALPTFRAFQLQLIWIVPVFLLWKSASSVGLIETLSTDGLRGFWQGVGEYSGRAVLLALVFLVPLAVVAVGIGVAFFIFASVFSGEVGTFWTLGVALPVTVILSLSLLDLMHDYARISLVVGRKPVMDSMLKGVAWPFRHPGSIMIYAGWFIVSAIIIALVTISDFRPGGLWGIFLLEQVFLFVRAGVTVGWFGSEIEYFDGIATRELPLIAETHSVETGTEEPAGPSIESDPGESFEGGRASQA